MSCAMSKLCLQLLRSSSTNRLSNISINYPHRLAKHSLQACFVNRTILTRPKELDELNRKALQKMAVKEHDDYDSRYHNDKTDEVFGLYEYFLISIPIITFGLGTWQIFRRKEKLALIALLEERLSRPPVELPENLDDLAKLEYCPIKVRGEFLYDKEFVIGPRSLIVDGRPATENKGNLISTGHLNKGYNVITPFRVEGRDLVILVNRGWLPHKYKLKQERLKCQNMKGEVEIIGINRLTEIRPQFVPKNSPEKGVWHYRDVYEMAEFANTDPILLDMIDYNFGPDAPVGGQYKVHLRNEHLSYIVTWYGLSAITALYCYRMYILKIPLV